MWREDATQAFSERGTKDWRKEGFALGGNIR
jgi:hypothetical protein